MYNPPSPTLALGTCLVLIAFVAGMIFGHMIGAAQHNHSDRTTTREQLVECYNHARYQHNCNH